MKRLFLKLNKVAQDSYLDILVATEHPKQAPEYQYAKWYHLFWLLVPIVGIVFFIESIRSLAKDKK